MDKTKEKKNPSDLKSMTSVHILEAAPAATDILSMAPNKTMEQSSRLSALATTTTTTTNTAAMTTSTCSAADLLGNNVVQRVGNNETQQSVRSRSVEGAQVFRYGRWTVHEHAMFLEGLERFPKGNSNRWRRISDYIGTRTILQTRTHAQKFFNRNGQDDEAFHKTKRRHQISSTKTKVKDTTTSSKKKETKDEANVPKKKKKSHTDPILPLNFHLDNEELSLMNSQRDSTSSSSSDSHELALYSPRRSINSTQGLDDVMIHVPSFDMDDVIEQGGFPSPVRLDSSTISRVSFPLEDSIDWLLNMMSTNSDPSSTSTGNVESFSNRYQQDHMNIHLSRSHATTETLKSESTYLNSHNNGVPLHSNNVASDAANMHGNTFTLRPGSATVRFRESASDAYMQSLTLPKPIPHENYRKKHETSVAWDSEAAALPSFPSDAAMAAFSFSWEDNSFHIAHKQDQYDETFPSHVQLNNPASDSMAFLFPRSMSM